MLPPPLPCLMPSALCSSPSCAKIPEASMPPCWPTPQLPPTNENEEILNVEIRCSCHIDLLDAQFSISHNEQTNDFFVELLPPEPQNRLLSAPVLCILVRFLPSQPEHLQLFVSSYGHWHQAGRVFPCRPRGAQPLRLHVHVHEHFYSVELDGIEVLRLKHKRPFQMLPEEEQKQHEATTMEGTLCCTCRGQLHVKQQQQQQQKLMMAAITTWLPLQTDSS